MNIAITAEPIRWIGSRLSSQHARRATPTDNIIPGKTFNTFINNLLLSLTPLDYTTVL
jgi:hypothetical protein